jgi:hypothetical protein
MKNLAVSGLQKGNFSRGYRPRIIQKTASKTLLRFLMLKCYWGYILF